MKRIFAIFLTISVVFTLSGCNKKASQASTPTVNQPTISDNTTSKTLEKKLNFIEITPEVPNQYYIYTDGMGFFTYNSKCGYLGKDGKVAIEPKYKEGTLFSEGFAIVEDVNENLIIIDKQGKEVFTSAKYKLISRKSSRFNEGVAILYKKINKQYVIVDTTGKELSVMEQNSFIPQGMPSCGVIVWSGLNSNKIKLTDVNGKQLVKEITTGYGANNMPQLYFNDNLLSIPNFDNTWNVIDTSGNKIFKDNYEELKQPSEGLIAFKKYAKWGYIDYKGNVKIEPQYEDAKGFSNELAAVKVNGKIGFIDKENKMVIKPQFQPESSINATIFNQFDKNDVAIVPDNNGSVIDKLGNVILSPNKLANIFYEGDGIICFYNKESSYLYKLNEK